MAGRAEGGSLLLLDRERSNSGLLAQERAAGIADTLALGILCGPHGAGITTAVLPYVNTAMVAHPAYGRSRDQLREMGILIESYEPHRAGRAMGWTAAGGRGAGAVGGQDRWLRQKVIAVPLWREPRQGPVSGSYLRMPRALQA